VFLTELFFQSELFFFQQHILVYCRKAFSSSAIQP